jgi:ribonuclease E
MASKAAEKIIDALTQLVEGFAELQESIEIGVPAGDEDESDDAIEEIEAGEDVEDALVAELRTSIESVIENEDCSPEDLASIISALTDALEEIDPDVFASSADDEDEDEDDSTDTDEEYDEDDEDYDDSEEDDEEEEDDDDDDLDDDDLDEDEEDDEEEVVGTKGRRR